MTQDSRISRNDVPRSRRVRQIRLDRHRQQLESGAHGRDGQHTERHQVKTGKRQPEAAVNRGKERRSGGKRCPAGQMEHQGGREKPERDRGRQQPATGSDHDGSRASLMRTSPSR
jgi:hypothetical protein